jgi:protein tyrosine phosphatase
MRIGLCWISIAACTLILATALGTEVTRPISLKAITTLPHDLSREDINTSALSPYLDLLDFKGLQAKSEQALSEEFMALDRLCAQKKHINNLYHSADVVKHNRYKDILPFKTNRVTLDGPEEPSTYINANYISNPYTGARKVFIATQGPVPRSFNNFWRMVWQERVDKVVMLCSFTEEEEGVRVTSIGQRTTMPSFKQ